MLSFNFTLGPPVFLIQGDQGALPTDSPYGEVILI